VNSIVKIGSEVLFFYYLLSNLVYTVLFFAALISKSKHQFRINSVRFATLKQSPFLPRITVLVPARDEALTIVSSVQALLALDYPDLEVIVANDGSRDATLDNLKDAYALRVATLLYVPQIRTAPVRGVWLSNVEPRLIVVDKESGGSKADAINAALNAASGSFVCVVDADSILEHDALLRITSAVFTDTGSIVAGGGIVRVLNGSAIEEGRVRQVELPSRPIEVLQVIEYLRAFLIGREGWGTFDMLPIISGAFGVFRTGLVRAIGGFDPNSVGEDLDLVVRLHRRLLESGESYRIAFVPDPTCWTQVPADLKSLARQRSRWQRGLAQVLWRNRDMLFRPRYGRVGAVMLPYLWVFELAEPFIELFGWLSIVAGALLHVLSRAFLFEFLIYGYAFGTAISLGAVLLEELTYRRYQDWKDVARLIFYSFLEHIPYRQMHMWWRVKGVLQRLFGFGHHWHQMKRSKFGQPAPAAEGASASSK
jgi:cellulose synthase/poly-beta-1,6-N-acetylglucosamine synthase-like glycosyltransferase